MPTALLVSAWVAASITGSNWQHVTPQTMTRPVEPVGAPWRIELPSPNMKRQPDECHQYGKAGEMVFSLSCASQQRARLSSLSL